MSRLAGNITALQITYRDQTSDGPKRYVIDLQHLRRYLNPDDYQFLLGLLTAASEAVIDKRRS